MSSSLDQRAGVNKGVVMMTDDEARILADREDTIVYEQSEHHKVKPDPPMFVLAQMTLLRDHYIDAARTIGTEHFTDEELRAVAIRGRPLLTASIAKVPNTACMVTHRDFHDGRMEQLAKQLVFLNTIDTLPEEEKDKLMAEYIHKNKLSFRSRDKMKYVNSHTFDVCEDPARLAEIFAVYDGNKARGVVRCDMDMSPPPDWGAAFTNDSAALSAKPKRRRRRRK